MILDVWNLQWNSKWNSNGKIFHDLYHEASSVCEIFNSLPWESSFKQAKGESIPFAYKSFAACQRKGGCV